MLTDNFSKKLIAVDQPRCKQMIISHFPDVDNGRVFTLSNYALFSRRTSANEFSEDSAYRYNLSEEDHKIQQLFKSKVIKRQRGFVKGLYTFPIRGVEGWYSAKMYLQNSEESKVYGEILTLDSFSIEEWCLLDIRKTRFVNVHKRACTIYTVNTCMHDTQKLIFIIRGANNSAAQDSTKYWVQIIIKIFFPFSFFFAVRHATLALQSLLKNECAQFIPG